MPLPERERAHSNSSRAARRWTFAYDADALEFSAYIDSTSMGTKAVATAPFGGAEMFGPDGISTLIFGTHGYYNEDDDGYMALTSVSTPRTCTATSTTSRSGIGASQRLRWCS